MPGAMTFCSSSKSATDLGPGQPERPSDVRRATSHVGPRTILDFRGFSAVLDGTIGSLQVFGDGVSGRAPAGGKRRPVIEVDERNLALRGDDGIPAVDADVQRGGGV